jgi:hypothetical protein
MHYPLKKMSTCFPGVTAQLIRCMTILQHWIPAFAGMTSRTMPFSSEVIPAKAGAFRYPGLFLDVLSNYPIF